MTKSLAPLLPTLSTSTSSEARLMMVPAVRAAFTAMLSMGCRVCCDMGRSSSGVGRTSIQACKHAGAGAGGAGGEKNGCKAPWGRQCKDSDCRAAPDTLANMPVLDPHPRFILVETSHPGNVGAVARAMKVMGFADLVLTC